LIFSLFYPYKYLLFFDKNAISWTLKIDLILIQDL